MCRMPLPLAPSNIRNPDFGESCPGLAAKDELQGVLRM